MPNPLTGYIADCLDSFKDENVYLGNVKTYIYGAGTQLKLGNYVNAGSQLQLAGDNLGYWYLTYNSRYYIWKYALIDALEWIDDNWPEPVEELTWKTIVEAWIKNDFEGRVVTIATIDRMRQILWNEPFNVVWAARPEERKI